MWLSYPSLTTPWPWQCGAIPWEKYGVELVLECSGEFLTTENISPQVRVLLFPLWFVGLLREFAIEEGSYLTATCHWD